MSGYPTTVHHSLIDRQASERRIHPTATLRGHSLGIGSGVHIGRDTTVGVDDIASYRISVYLFDGVSIGDDSSVESTLYEDVAVGDGNKLGISSIGEAAVLGNGVTLGNNSHVGYGSVVEDDVTIGNLVRLYSDIRVGAGVTIGDRAVIFAGEIPDGTTIPEGALVDETGLVGTTSRRLGGMYLELGCGTV